ncbi:MAG: SDR family oxidoreductase, partial [Bradymonadaceae bacterium]
MKREKLVVFGGSGFIGREVCRLGRALGHRMISISRGGRPKLDEPWVQGVEWVQADALEPATWRPLLEGAYGVVHCVGTSSQGDEPAQSFMHLNRDSAIYAAREAEAAKVRKFVFLSASQAPPSIPEAYLTTKREAEAVITGMDLISVFLRPAIVYGDERPLSKIAAHDEGREQDWIENFEPLRVERVAMAALRAVLEEEIEGILDEAAIEHLGDAVGIGGKVPVHLDVDDDLIRLGDLDHLLVTPPHQLHRLGVGQP